MTTYILEGNKRRGVGDSAPMSVDQLGELITMGWKQAALNAGELFYAKVGALSTPIVGGGAGTIIDQDQPEFGLSIPAGMTVQLIRVSAQMTIPLLATDDDESEILVAADKAAASALDGTWANTITPINLKTIGGTASRCTVKSVCSVNATNPTLDLELFRDVVTGEIEGAGAASYWKQHNVLYAPDECPLLVGPASVFIYWGGTVATYAFMQAIWREIATASIQNG
jgi:hypothetical protein